jgi:hypothetical protein
MRCRIGLALALTAVLSVVLARTARADALPLPNCGTCETHYLFGNPWHDFHGGCSSGPTAGCHTDGQNGTCADFHGPCLSAVTPDELRGILASVLAHSDQSAVESARSILGLVFNPLRRAYQGVACDGTIVVHIPVSSLSAAAD